MVKLMPRIYEGIDFRRTTKIGWPVDGGCQTCRNSDEAYNDVKQTDRDIESDPEHCGADEPNKDCFSQYFRF